MSESDQAEATSTRPPNARKGGKSNIPSGMMARFAEQFGAAIELLTGAPVKAEVSAVNEKPLHDCAGDPEASSLFAILDLFGAKKSAYLRPDSALLYHAVDIMFGADPESDDTPKPRPPSALDRKLGKSLGDAAAQLFAAVVADSVGPPPQPNCACSGMADDFRSAAIARETASVLLIEMTFSFGNSARKGMVEFCIPLATLDLIFGGASKGPVLRASKDPWFQHMKTAVVDLELEMLAVVHTEQMNVAALSRLDVGDVLHLPKECIATTRLILGGDRETLSSGELGATAGRRAVRLSAPPCRTFFDPLIQLSTAV